MGWFGSNDPIILKGIKKTGATCIVTVLHQIPVGDNWTVKDKLKNTTLGAGYNNVLLILRNVLQIKSILCIPVML